MEKLNNDLFKKKQIKNSDKIIGGVDNTSVFSDGTSRFSDCNPTSYEDDNTGWISDSRSENTDTGRTADSCNG